MKTIDEQLQDLMVDCVDNGQKRSTRSGMVRGVFRREIVWDMRHSLPFPMTKKLMYKAMMGELLWFINGETTLSTLRSYSCLTSEAWTIWTNDCERWHKKPRVLNEIMASPDDLGKLYGHQWRRFGEDEMSGVEGVDQLQNLVDDMQHSPTSRYLIVQAYNPVDIKYGEMALPPCHTGFQVYVDVETGEFDLNWSQRSCDVFLGIPFNIASYGMLMMILGKLTGLTPRFLYGDLKDTHVYEAHIPAVETQLDRNARFCTAFIEMPEFESLDDLKNLTAEDFVLVGYEPDPGIKAPLLVG